MWPSWLPKFFGISFSSGFDRTSNGSSFSIGANLNGFSYMMYHAGQVTGAGIVNFLEI